MHEILKLIEVQLRGAWRYRWPAIAAMWGIAILGWIGVAFIPNSYTAHARVYVDTDSVLKPLLTGLAVGTDVQSEVAVMSRILLSRPNMEKVARDTDLYLRARTPAQHQELIDGLQKRIEVLPSKDNIYSISFTDTDRAMSQRVVQTVLTAFVEDTLGVKRADTGEAQKFLQDQIQEYERRLHEAEDRLAEFKRHNVGLMPGESGDYYRRLQSALERQTSIKADLDLASARRDELNRQLAGEEPTFGIAQSAGQDAGTSTSVDSQISTYQARLATLLVEYTDKHPEVISLRETIARLEAQRAEEAATRRKSSSGLSRSVNPLNINPVYQSMRIALSQAEVQVVELRDKYSAAAREVSQLRGMVNTVPEVEAELVRLNRDYEVNRAQHQALLQRLESARLSESADQSKEHVRFRVIEPPTLPLEPTAPKRLLFNSAVLVFAIGAGLALAVLLYQMNPIFATRTQLAASTGFTVLGAVSFISFDAPPAFLRRQPVLAGGALGLLLVVYVTGLAITEWLARSAQSLVQQ